MDLRRFGSSVLLAALLALALPLTNARAQIPSGTVRGQVTDPSGAAIPRASITAHPASGQPVTVQAGADGAYVLKLAPGTYTVNAAAPNFAPFELQDLKVTAGQSQKLDISLTIQIEQQQVEVTGQANRVSVNPENNASALVIKGKDLETLSDDPDEMSSELQALSGPSTGPNGGEIYIDGFTGGQLPPKSAIREIRVNQNPFSAQYDRLGYGRIEILTKPGQDKLHGQAFVNGNDSAFNSRNPFATTVPAYHSLMFDGNLGGPLTKKASFFVDGQRRNIQDQSIVTALCPNVVPGTNASGVDCAPGSTFSESVFNPQTRTEVSPRVDYQLTPSNTLTARYQYFDNTQKNQGVGQLSLPSLAYNAGDVEHTLQVSDSQVLGERTVNETRFQYRHEREDQTPLSTAAQVNVQGAFVSGGSGKGTMVDTENSYELQNYTSMQLTHHFVRFGVRLRDWQVSNYSTSNFNGTFTFSSYALYQAAELALHNCGTTCPSGVPGANQFTITNGQALATVNYWDLEPYVEDDWRLRPNITLSAGLRYESQNQISDHRDLAPRVGFAWGIGGGKNRTTKTVLRGGFGVFYDRFREGLVLQAERLNGVNQQQYTATNPAFYNPNASRDDLLKQVQGSVASTSVYHIDPTVRAPYSVQSAIGLEHQVSKAATVSVTYINSHGLHQLMTRNINAPHEVGSLINVNCGLVDADCVRPGPPPETSFPPLDNVFQYESVGLFNQNQLITNFNIRGPKISLFGFYTLSYANSDVTGTSLNPGSPMDPYNIAADYGRAAFDIHHRLFVGGSYNLPKGFQIFPFIFASSGAPYNITVGRDLNGDSIFNDRPGIPTDLSGPTVIPTYLGSFDLRPVPGQPILPINDGNGPGAVTFNLRVSKTFGFGREVARGAGGGGGGFGGGRGGPGGGLGPRGLGGGGGNPFSFGNATNHRYNLTLSVSARNLFNNVNLAPPIAVLTSPLFGQSIALAGGPFSSQAANRRIDLQARLSF
jgi:hypothetical protein